MGHAKVILGLPDGSAQKEAARAVTAGRLSVRQTEEWVAAQAAKSVISSPASGSAAVPPPRDAHVADLQAKLQERFGTKVAVRYRSGKGSIELKFFNDDDLERILKISGISLD